MKIIIPNNKKIACIEVSQLLYVLAFQNYSKVYLDDGSMIFSNLTISKIEEQLGSSFFRCHRSYLVNLEKVTSFQNKGILELNHQVEIPISRRKKTDFVQLWKNYLGIKIYAIST